MTVFIFILFYALFDAFDAQEMSWNHTLLSPLHEVNSSLSNMDTKLIKASTLVTIDHKISIVHPTSEEEIPEARTTLNSFIKYTSSVSNNNMIIVMDYLILMPRKAINRTDFCISKTYSPTFRIK